MSEQQSSCASEEKLSNEIWKVIPGFGGRYMVSERGNFKSVLTRGGRSRERLIKLSTTKWGYLFSHVSYCGKNHLLYMHRLVLTVFGSHPPSESHTVNHIDGNKQNNAISNLEWLSFKDNTRHAFSTGLCHMKRVGWHSRVVITPEKVRAIRDRRGEATSAIAKDFGVSRSTIQKILNGRAWSYVP